MKIASAFNYFFGRILNKRNVRINHSLNYLHRKREIDRNYMDYIRLATLELVATEINKKNRPGAVAELGVYKGKFARYINQYFPSRKLYLFDTFEGFDKTDIATELQKSFSSGEQDFSNTSVEGVLKQMPFREKCIIKQGYFPASAEGMEEEFIFVSIDTDLYEPIYSGLNYFYPRLMKGGYIFVHDYNNDGYKGAKVAVEKFCAEQGISKTPIPDSGGTVVLGK
ncbi:MAG TPA: TylF/MycF/NovP-related O-methyltransferase [Ferruginibacter sp.]|nr:TylF/MycF/NovP-related O-methyltransferase [Ferruginibacter sp.]